MATEEKTAETIQMSEQQEQKNSTLDKDEPAQAGLDQDGYYKEGTVREVGVFMEIIRISNIDTASQTFQAQFELQFTWVPSKEDMANFERDSEEYTPSFVPKYNWINCEDVEMELDDRGYEVLVNGGKDTWGNTVELSVPFVNVALYDVKGTFFVPYMNLKNFPFDVIDLPIQLECQQQIDSVIFVPSFDVSSEVIDVMPECDKLNPEFSLEKPLLEVISVEADGEQYCNFVVHVKFIRHWSTYGNIYFTLFLLCIATSCVYAIHVQDGLSDRISNLFTMLLTVVAYEFILASELPKIPYKTLADYYIFGCFFYLIVIVIEVVIVGIFAHDEHADDIDAYGVAVIMGLFFIANIVYMVTAVKRRKFELTKLKWYQKDFEEQYKNSVIEKSEEETTAVEHTECQFGEKVEKRLGTHWKQYLQEEEK